MALSAALTATDIANAVAGQAVSEVRPTNGMQGYEVWNRSGLTVYLVDDRGLTIDAIQPYSQRSGTIILATTNLTFAVTKTDPIVPSIGYPSSTWQVLYQVVDVPLPQMSTPINTGATQAGTPMQALASGTVPGAALTTVNVPITADMTSIIVYGAAVNWNGYRVSGHQSGMFFRGVSGIDPSGGVPLTGINSTPIVTAFDTSLDVEFSMAGGGSMAYWIAGRRDSFEVSVDQYGNTVINVQNASSAGVAVPFTVQQAPQPQSAFTMQNAATGNGNGTGAPTSGLNGAQMVELFNTGTGTCTVNLQGSYDGTNWYNVGYYQVDGVSSLTRSAAAISVTASTFRHVYQLLDYYPNVRAAISATAGSIVCTALLKGVPI